MAKRKTASTKKKSKPAAKKRATPAAKKRTAPAAKKPSAPAAKKTPAASGDAEADLQARLDALDREVLKQLNERARLAKKIGQLKEARGGPRYQPEREQDVFARIVRRNRGPLADRCIRAVFRELVSGCRVLQTPLKVAYLGPPYSYSHMAAVEQFGQSAELVPVATIASVFEEVNHKQADFGLVPIENSTDGRVADTLDMFTRLPARIRGEVQLRIHHNLLGKCARADVQEVYSKPQALSQCRDWLARHLPSARTIEMTSTAAAAQLSAEKQGAAAIASLQAAANYGLDVIAADIEDSKHNVTRFAIIGEVAAARTGKDKTSLMFQVEHRPGALAEAMNIFKRNRLNLTWIESFPISGARKEYMFFVEMEGHETDAKVKTAIETLDDKSLRLVVLGSYAMTGVVE